MVPSLLAALLVLSHPQVDTAAFQDAATAQLFARARVRHIRQDQLVSDYTATVRTRVDLTAGRSRFARQTPLVVHETVARLTWQKPNDLRVQVLGARSAAPILRIVAKLGADVRGEMTAEDAVEFAGWLDRPWFIPRALSDSVRLMGIPERAAVHPLAEGATDQYRYAITDSVLMNVSGRSLRAVKMRVEPKQLGPSLVAGDMWIDRETADVVRLTIVFVGEYLWEQPEGDTPEDSARAQEDNKWANRFLTVEADIEYAWIEKQYWLPYRQFLSLTAEIPWFINAALPARAVSTFSDYEVNTSPDVAFVVPVDDSLTRGGRATRVRVKRRGDAHDSDRSSSRERYEYGYYRAGTWSDGRWEVELPPADSLAAYGWLEEFKVSRDKEEEQRLTETIAALAELAEDLPDEWVGRRTYGLAWEQFADIVRFNRVQGLSVGLGYQLRPGPSFTTVLLSGRFGFSDQRPTGSVIWRRDAPAGRFDLTGFRSVREVEPWTGGLGVGNSLNALFTAHDDADYFLSLGGGFSYVWNAGLLRDTEFRLSVERQRTMEVASGSAVADIWGSGSLEPNPPVAEAWMLRGSLARLSRFGLVRLEAGAEALMGDSLVGGRLWGSSTVPFRVFGRTGTLTLRAAAMRGDSLPQLFLRLGGPWTVRGYTYGTLLSREIWSAQLDFAVRRSPVWAPVVFVDVGDGFTWDPMVGAGAGISILNGLVRFNLAKGLSPSTGVRFDIQFRAPR